MIQIPSMNETAAGRRVTVDGDTLRRSGGRKA